MSNILLLFLTDIKTSIITVVIGFCVYKIAKLYVTVYSLPPGPLPVPFIGNILYFRSAKEHWSTVLRRLSPRYGPVFTLYLGNKPVVFIRDIDIARDAFRRNDFAGRPDILFGALINDDTGADVVFSDYGHTWEALRRVSHSAAQKYSTSEKLVFLVSDCVDEAVDLMLSREGFDRPFVPFDYIFHMFLNIIANSAFGKGFNDEDIDYKQIKYVLKDFADEYALRFIMWEFVPLFRRIDRKNFNYVTKVANEVKDSMKMKFTSHVKTYDESVVRDFCDALIAAKNEAIAEGKESAPYLTDGNLSLAVLDLFFAGIHTSYLTFEWLLLFLLYYPKIGHQLRQEIETQIGDRMPTHEDRGRCHYVMAFIAETLRFRNIIPTGTPHKAVVRSKIADYTIPEGTVVIAYQGHILMDEKHWPNPDQFKPERFLENGVYIKTRSSAFIPFGVGRRVCLGEKLAIADLFLVLVRFMQKTNEYNLCLRSHRGIDGDPSVRELLNTFDYEILFEKK